MTNLLAGVNLFLECYKELVKMTELENENKELKTHPFSLRNERNTFLKENEQYEKDLIKFNEQLTTAKEIIKKIEKIFYSGENAVKRLSEISDILTEAEQFINEKC